MPLRFTRLLSFRPAGRIHSRQNSSAHEEPTCASLNCLARQLARDNDARTETCLEQLRSLRVELQLAINSNMPAPVAAELNSMIEEVFWFGAERLRTSMRLHERTLALIEPAKTPFLELRSALIRDALSTVYELEEVLTKLKALSTNRLQRQTRELRQELEETICAVLSADEQLRQIEARVRV
jgi:hypothetical protein